MSRDVYGALSGAVGAWRQFEVIANNIANADTTGFRGARVTFEAQGPDGAYARIADTLVDRRSGTARNTGNPTDVALRGPGWLVIDGGGSPLLTRDGHLHVDPMDGTLRTADGLAVMGENGPIVAPPGQAVRIDAEGLVTAEDGTELDRMRVVEAATEPVGGNLHRPAGPLVDLPASLVPGALESSNVDPVRAMVELVEAGHTFEAFQKVMQTSDELDGRLNDSGRG